jgi:hypothetical protein
VEIEWALTEAAQGISQALGYRDPGVVAIPA